MSWYTRRVVPWLIERGMRNPTITRYRNRVPTLAEGRVLEIGMGAGGNLPYYTSRVTHFFGLEPSDYLRNAAAAAADSAPFPVTLIGAGAEAIPIEDGSVDTIVSTWSLCSIPAIDDALLEMRRVLRPGGRLLFMEHGRAPDVEVARLQDRLEPVFQLLAGCSPNRPMADLIATAGFRMVRLDASYLDGPRFISFHYVGEARP